MSQLRLLVIGAEGQVARALREAAAGAPDLVLGCAARPQLDLTRPETIAPAMEAFRPDVVINPAAYTAVDRAEAEPNLAFAVNGDGAGAVAASAARLGAPIVHVSTDYVFDGAKAGPYTETDAPSPRTMYGGSKLAGEAAVAAAAPRHVILRTAWVYAPYGGNFVRTMARLSTEREALRVVDDQFGCPTYAPDLAAAVLAIARMLATGWRDDLAGVTHLAGPDALSWCAFARCIVAEGARAGVARCVPVEAIATADYPTAAPRPANSRLSSERAAQVFGVRLPPLEVSLTDCLARMAGAEGAPT